MYFNTFKKIILANFEEFINKFNRHLEVNSLSEQICFVYEYFHESCICFVVLIKLNGYEYFLY